MDFPELQTWRVSHGAIKQYVRVVPKTETKQLRGFEPECEL